MILTNFPPPPASQSVASQSLPPPHPNLVLNHHFTKLFSSPPCYITLSLSPPLSSSLPSSIGAIEPYLGFCASAAMGTISSKSSDSSHGGREGGGQLYVSLKMENFRIRADLIPHVYGSVPIIGSWDSAKAVHISSSSSSLLSILSCFPNSRASNVANLVVLDGTRVSVDVGAQLRRPSQSRYALLLECLESDKFIN